MRFLTPHRPWLHAGLLLWIGACDTPAAQLPDPDPPTPTDDRAGAAQTLARGPEEAPAAPPPRGSPVRAGEQIEVPAGTLTLGSRPGSEGRDAASEADAVSVQVPSFRIDRLPYPNDPSQPFEALTDRDTAQDKCAAQDKRLCHEIEWERACKGDDAATYPTRTDRWSDDPCGEDGLECSSPLGVLRMGTEGREWTGTDTTPGLGDRLRTAVVRGAASEDPGFRHRCAARDAATPDSRSDTLLFRCCQGPEPALTYPSEPARPSFRLAPMSTKEARALLAKLPEVEKLAASFVPFSGNDYETALGKGGKSAETIAPWIPLEHPLVWSPVHGEEVWVLSGRAGKDAVILFAYADHEGSLTFGGSFELQGEPDPVAVAFHPERPRELLWSSCWGCGGEGGSIALREDGRVVITQR